LVKLGFALRDEATLAGIAERVIDSLQSLDKKLIVLNRVLPNRTQGETLRISGTLGWLGILNAQLHGMGFPTFSFEKWKFDITGEENIYTQVFGKRKVIASDSVVFPHGIPDNVITAPMEKFVRDYIPREHKLRRALRFISPKTIIRITGYNALIAAPFLNSGKVAGNLAIVGSSTDPPLTSEDIDLVRSVANLISIHLTNISSRVALEASEAKWTALIEHSIEGIALCRGGQIELGNPRFTELMGLTAPCPLEDFIDLAAEENRESCRQRFLHGASPSGEIEITIRDSGRKNSGTAPGGKHHQSISHSSGEFDIALEARSKLPHILRISYSFFPYEGTRSLLLFLHDVTQERRLETDLAEQERIASLGVVAAGLSHELNNPLAAILTHVELLERHYETGPESAKFFDVIGRNMQKMKHILHELSRFAEERLPLPAYVSLRNVLGEYLDEMEEYLKDNDVEVIRGFAEFEDTVEADSRLLGQALGNLITNAVAAMDKKPYRIIITCEPVSPETRAAIIRVKDNGSGIPMEIRDRIFEPFFSARKGSRGSGLGLAIVKKIVRTHRGSINLTSEEGKGTTFSITLPLRGAATPHSKPEQS
jgi:signal transduction histidine kinase